jgi:hypothetical protein
VVHLPAPLASLKPHRTGASHLKENDVRPFRPPRADLVAGDHPHQHAVTLFAELDDWHTQALALNGLGNVLAQTQGFEEAITAYTEAAGIFEEFGDEHNRDIALRNLERTRHHR